LWSVSQVRLFYSFKFGFKFGALLSHTERPSIDPKLMIRMLIVGY